MGPLTDLHLVKPLCVCVSVDIVDVNLYPAQLEASALMLHHWQARSCLMALILQPEGLVSALIILW